MKTVFEIGGFVVAGAADDRARPRSAIDAARPRRRGGRRLAACGRGAASRGGGAGFCIATGKPGGGVNHRVGIYWTPRPGVDRRAIGSHREPWAPGRNSCFLSVGAGTTEEVFSMC